ncbi:MAG: mannose-1-phosphate guanylyltransferase/mannose-6-phosphate isomerase [Xanthomonadales bacterium]|nr:mannose-1-phosphate guanylyltransferase/mannose-6-phosphate isomerase [Xanthomonadales bacterium]
MLIPVILSGGAGTRLWPVSRRTSPKPFIRLPDGESLLAKTLIRALHVADPQAPVLTVTGREHYFLTREEYAKVAGSGQRELPFVLEPCGRNTAPAVLATALKLQRDHGDEVHMLVLPADHLITDLDGFADCVAQARQLAAQGHLVTFGLVPDRPETGYGYIRRGPAIAGSDGYRIDRFVEKPDAATAQRFLDGGEHYWNSGMFCFPVGALLANAERVAPDLLAAVQGSLPATANNILTELDGDAFARVADISVDYAIMEPAGEQGAVVPARFDWSDIGSWDALGALTPADDSGNRVVGQALMVDSHDCDVRAESRLVAMVGARDLVVVETPDAVLVADRGHVQQVKQVVDQLRDRGHDSTELHLTVQRPWGSYTILEDAEDCKVKRLVVKPGQVLSLQLHHRRSEHWTVVQGTAKVRIGDEEFLLERNQSAYIPVQTLHRLENPTDQDIALIEVQCGDYFGEDDIVRLEDVYGRDTAPAA